MINKTSGCVRGWFLGAMLVSAMVTAPSTSWAARSGVGVNPAGVSFWQPQLLFSNLMKMSESNIQGLWMTQCDPGSKNQVERDGCKNFKKYLTNPDYGFAAYNTGEQDKLDLDENNYVKSLPAANDSSVKYKRVSRILLHSSAKHDAGTYTFTYEGDGFLDLWGNLTILENKPGSITFKYTGGQVDLVVTSINPNNYFRNMKLIPPGGACSSSPNNFALSDEACAGTYTPMAEYAKTHVFHPRFVADLKGYRVLRFMDIMQMNMTDKDATSGYPRHTLVHWTDRARRADVSYTEYEGLPFGTLFDLADETGADPWINIGFRAEDDVAVGFGKLAARRLAPGKTLYLEYGNEPWNFGGGFYVNYMLMRDRGDALFEGMSDTWRRGWNYYAYRSSKICQLVKEQMGTRASDVKCVLNSQPGYIDQNQEMLDCPLVVTKNLLGAGKSCKDVVDGLAIAPYFGGEAGDKNFKDKNGRTVAQWLTDSDGGKGALFTYLETEAIPLSVVRMKDSKSVADKRGKIFVAYEGGQHLVDLVSPQRSAVVQLFTDANRDSRMGTMYTKYLNEWKTVGGQTMVLFNSVGSYGNYGSWGLRETMQQTSTPKYNAVKSFRDTVACWWTGCN